MVEAHAWRRRGRSRGHAADATTEPVPGGDVQPAPFFDADADEAERVHLAWRALRGEVTYVRREASGAWTRPRVLGGRGRVFVRAWGRRVRVLVLAEGLLVHASDDRGETWTTAAHLPGVLAFDGAVAHLERDTLVVALVGWRGPVPDIGRVGHGWAPPDPYPGRSTQAILTVVALRSADGGASWSAPSRVGLAERELPLRGVGLVGGRALRLSALARGDGGTDLYLAISQMQGPTSGMRIARSADGGGSWSALVPLAVPDSPPLYGTGHEAADVVPHGGAVGLCLHTSGRAALVAGPPTPGEPPSEWHPAIAWPAPGPTRRPTRVLALHDGRVVAVWNDTRRARRAWWANTALMLLAGWNGVWAQSDLFATTWRAGGETGAPRAVTRHGGRVWDASRLFLVGDRVGDRVGVAWRGSATSGRHGGVPMRLFLSRFSPS